MIRQIAHSVLLVVIFLIRGTPGAAAAGGTPPNQIQDVLEVVHLPVTRDTWVSSVEGERDANLGGASRLKTKGIQEFAIIDVDPSPVRGRVVVAATLHLHCRSKDPQRRLTVSTLASDWVEGVSTTYRPRVGAASFLWAQQDRRFWAYPGSDITAVINGRGHTIWGFSDATAPSADGWQHVAVRPAVVAARVAGVSYGFVVFDDVGSEYTRRGQRFTYHLFPNRYFASRQAGRRLRPYLTVELGVEDHLPPVGVDRVGQARADEPLPPGQAIITWNTPADVGPAGTIGFDVRVDDASPFRWDDAQAVPRYLIPMARRAGEPVTMLLRDLGFEPGSKISVGVRPIDAAGNRGPVSVGWAELSGPAPPDPLASVVVPVELFAELASPPRLGEFKVSVIDPLDKVHPVTGQMIPRHQDGYLQANHLWSASQNLVRLFAAKNEFVSFQILLEGDPEPVHASLRFPNRGPAAARTKVLCPLPVPTPIGDLPDPVIEPWKSRGREPVKGQRFTTLLAEIYVPHDAPAGIQEGTLRLETQDGAIDVEIELRVWDFTLPDYLSFIPQMNCYGLPGPPQEVKYYRLAHIHRTCLNRLPYNWTGQVRGGHAPDRRGDGWDWRRFDRRFGPLLDGSAFKDLPRKSVPIDAFYLPINENWPMDLERSFKGSYWADEAFTPGYRRQFMDACRRFTGHLKDRGWNDTHFEFYLNNKVFFKRPGWGRCSAPWIFDEPVHTQDFWALRWYGTAFHEAVTPVRGDVKMAFRCDISRPQWQRDLLDGLLDVNVVSGAMRSYHRVVIGRKARWGQLVYEYGGSNAITRSNVQPAAWCVDAWCLGADGVLPWQTVGNNRSWEKADSLSLFYPGGPVGDGGPVPSLRLKAYRRGQQDVEYLTILSRSLGLPRWAVGEAARKRLGVEAGFEKSSESDAGTLRYDDLTPEQLWDLRVRVGSLLDGLKPPAKRRWVDLRTPTRDTTQLRDLGHF